MDQLRGTPKVQSLGDREKRPNLTKLHIFFIYLRILSQTTEQTISLITSRKHPIGVWQMSSPMATANVGAGLEFVDDAVASATCPGVRQYAAVQTQKGKKGLKKMKFNFFEKQTSRREMLRNSATLAGGALLALR